MPDGQAGLIYWKEAARGGDLTPLRWLLGEIFGNTSLGAWLRSNPSDDDVRSRLLSRVEFVTRCSRRPSSCRTTSANVLVCSIWGKGTTRPPLMRPCRCCSIACLWRRARRTSRRAGLVTGDFHRALEDALPRMGVFWFKHSWGRRGRNWHGSYAAPIATWSLDRSRDGGRLDRACRRGWRRLAVRSERSWQVHVGEVDCQSHRVGAWLVLRFSAVPCRCG